MGDVVVRVKLTNLFDTAPEAAAVRPPRSVEVDAVVDTGAVRSVISQNICDRLGLSVHHDVAHGIIFEILGRDVGMAASVSGDRLRIGSTVLAELDLVIDAGCAEVVTNPRNPDGPVLALRSLRCVP